jgi:pyrimidine-nucleoside phosphorylase
MRMYDIIHRKRDGGRLTPAEVEFFVQGYTAGDIPDYQAAALLMAIYFRGLEDDELGWLTTAMTASGAVYDLSHIRAVKVDKHSTGGVGDGVSLSLAPLVASCGVAVPMMSGRALGHTGGTLDKLESIPGFRVSLTSEEFSAQLQSIGVAMIGQTPQIAPADRKLYALRDATATVESIPLIAASIMSKKLAEGTDALVLDVKTGSGAFMKTMEDAQRLAELMVRIGRHAGKKVRAVVSDMNQPLGRWVGNAVEVAQAVDILRGAGPPDITELVMLLGIRMLVVSGGARDEVSARASLTAKIRNGEGLEKFRRMVAAQGGNPRVADDPASVLPVAKHREPVVATRAGYVTAINTRAIGIAVSVLGAGRSSMDDGVDPAVGAHICKKHGDAVAVGEPLCWCHYSHDWRFEEAQRLIREAYRIDDERPARPYPLVHRDIA